MQTNVMERSVAQMAIGSSARAWEDPLDHDATEDALLVTTRRSLVRLVLVAAETGARFAREGTDADPVAWMLAPRRLFNGRSAIEACQRRDGCVRAILLHGLSIGLDADPEDLDDLASEDADCDDADYDGDGGGGGDEDAGGGVPPAVRHDKGGRPRLWTSFLVGEADGEAVQAFDAFVTDGRVEAEARLRARHGAAFADGFEVQEGFDASLPLAEALVSPALADMLQQVAADPASPLAEGLCVSVRQRFAA